MSMIPFDNAVFENQTIVMDGKYFNGCTIRNCTLVYTGGDFGFNTSLCGDDGPCDLQFEGAALRTIQYLYRWGKITDEFAREMGLTPKDPI